MFGKLSGRTLEEFSLKELFLSEKMNGFSENFKLGDFFVKIVFSIFLFCGNQSIVWYQRVQVLYILNILFKYIIFLLTKFFSKF